jgi:Putative esterase
MNLNPLLISMCLAFPAQPTAALQVELSFSKIVSADAFGGRVFVIASRNPIGDKSPPPPGWFKPYPFFAQEVTKWSPDTPLKFEPKFAFPVASWDKLPKEKLYLQAILDRDVGNNMNFNSSPGNGYSKPVMIDMKMPPEEPIKLHIDRVVPERKFTEKGRVKYVEIDSKLLSAFHKKPMKLRAGVVLPKSFDKPEDEPRKYPVIYEIPGFGGNHFGALNAESRTDVAGVEMLYVVLDPGCRLGHHVFADSDNNGPVGKALVEELIPAIEAKYRGIARPCARFVTGHSSGGWSSLWLQVTYPDFFGGVWSTAPDPVDFRDFQKIDIYNPKHNMFVDDKNQSRPIARTGGKVVLHYKPFNDMEVVMGRGGQLFSFEAVFSPRGKDGKPMPLWNRDTGVIDPQVVKAWQRYDIRMILERDWKTLGPKLAGKLHVYMGAEDTFYLEGATRLLQESQKKLGSDAVIEIFPDRDHGNLMNSALRQRVAREMAATFGLSK